AVQNRAAVAAGGNIAGERDAGDVDLAAIFRDRATPAGTSVLENQAGDAQGAVGDVEDRRRTIPAEDRRPDERDIHGAVDIERVAQLDRLGCDRRVELNQHRAGPCAALVVGLSVPVIDRLERLGNRTLAVIGVVHRYLSGDGDGGRGRG